MRHAVIIGAIGFLSAAAAPAQQTYTFSRGYRPDHRYLTTAALVSDVSIDPPGGQGRMTVKAEQNYLYETKTGPAGPDGSFSLGIRFQEGAMTMHVRGAKREVDLTDKLQNLSITAVCSPDGSVGAIDIAQSGPADPGIDPMLEALGPQLLKESRIEFPAHPIAVGETFVQDLPIRFPVQGLPPLDARTRSTFTLRSVVGDLATFHVEHQIGLDGDGAPVTKLDGNGTGTIVFSFRHGFEVQVTQTTDVKTTVSQGGGMSMQIDATVQLTQTNTVIP